MGAAAEDGKGDKEAARGGGGEKKKKKKGEDPGPRHDHGDAAAAGSATAVYQFDMHCPGCAKKIEHAIKGSFRGVKADANSASGQLTVSGQLDPDKIRSLVEAKMHRRVNMVSFFPHATPPAAPPPSTPPQPPPPAPAAEVKPQPPAAPTPAAAAVDGAEKVTDKPKQPTATPKEPAPKVEGGGGGGGAEEKATAAKVDGGDDKPKQPTATPKPPATPVASTVVIRMRLHCDECIVRLKKKIFKMKGVQDVQVDAQKELVTVTGTMDTAAVPAYLKEKTGRSVEVIPSPAKAGGGAGGGEEKKNKEASSGGDEKPKLQPKEEKPQPQPKEEKPQPQQPQAAATANKMEYRGLGGEVAYAQPAPQAFAYSAYGGGAGAGPGYNPYSFYNQHHSYASPPPPQQHLQYAYPYPPPGADQAGPSSSSMPLAYPPYGGGFYPGAPPPGAPGMMGAGGSYIGGGGPSGYLEQAPQFFSDENPNGCFVM